MENAATILAIILAIALVVFIFFAVILTVLLLRINRQIKHIADKADLKLQGIGSLLPVVNKFTIPLGAVKLIIGLLKNRRKGETHVKRK